MIVTENRYQNPDSCNSPFKRLTLAILYKYLAFKFDFSLEMATEEHEIYLAL